jgi:hypothetical protein
MESPTCALGHCPEDLGWGTEREHMDLNAQFSEIVNLSEHVALVQTAVAASHQENFLN